MHAALSLERVTLRYAAGIPGCSAAITVLAGITFQLRAHEVVGICGEAGSGKSTLVLCAAGLLRPLAGDVRWFGRSRLADDAGARVVLVRHGAHGLRHALRTAPRNEPALFLLDDPFREIGGPDYARLARRIEDARNRGDAVLITARERAALEPLVIRVHTLRGGSIEPGHVARAGGERQARVAEGVEFG